MHSLKLSRLPQVIIIQGFALLMKCKTKDYKISRHKFRGSGKQRNLLSSNVYCWSRDRYNKG